MFFSFLLDAEHSFGSFPCSSLFTERERCTVYAGDLKWLSTGKFSGVCVGVPCWRAHAYSNYQIWTDKGLLGTVAKAHEELF